MNKDNPSQAPRKITGWVLKTRSQKANYRNRYGSIFTTSIIHETLQQFLHILIKKTDKGVEDEDGTEGWLGFYKSSGTAYSKSNIWENNHPLHLHNNQFRSWKKLYIKKKQKQKTQKISQELHKVTS